MQFVEKYTVDKDGIKTVLARATTAPAAADPIVETKSAAVTNQQEADDEEQLGRLRYREAEKALLEQEKAEKQRKRIEESKSNKYWYLDLHDEILDRGVLL